MRNRWNGDLWVALPHRPDPDMHLKHFGSHMFLLKGCELEPGIWAAGYFGPRDVVMVRRWRDVLNCREKVPISTDILRQRFSLWPHFQLFL